MFNALHYFSYCFVMQNKYDSVKKKKERFLMFLMSRGGFLKGLIMEQEMLRFQLVFKASRKMTTQWLLNKFTRHLIKLLSK